MPLRGDVGQLRDLSARLRLLANGDHLEVAAQSLKGAVMKLTADQFKAESDPYGARWAPLKRERTRNRKARKKGRKGGHKIGQDTGRMRASLSVSAQGRQLVIGYPVEYAEWFNDGTRRQASRLLVPSSARGLGPKWNDVIAREVKAALSASLGLE